MYYEIKPSDIDTVSELRHYINCTNDYEGLAKYFKTTPETIENIYENFRGKRDVQNIVNNYDKELEEYEKERNEYEMRQYEIEMRNETLFEQLEKSRKDFCGIGTRKVKLFLNKMILQNDILARAYRLALEIEDKNISAKKSQDRYGKYSEYTDKIYNQKHNFIRELIKLCEEANYVYGYQYIDDITYPNSIIYFELPNMEQISFHDNLSKEEISLFKKYEKSWDEKENSTLAKIEAAIMNTYVQLQINN